MSTVDRVPVADLCSLWAETPTTPMNIALIGVLDQIALTGGGDASCDHVLGRVRTAVQANLHRAPVLRQVLRFTRLGEGRPVWADDADFDICRHVVLPDQGPPRGGLTLLAAATLIEAALLRPPCCSRCLVTHSCRRHRITLCEARGNPASYEPSALPLVRGSAHGRK